MDGALATSQLEKDAGASLGVLCTPHPGRLVQQKQGLPRSVEKKN